MEMDPQVQKSFRIYYSLVKKLAELSKSTGKSQNELVNLALKEYLEKEDDSSK
ncbi:MAG: CopG family transcriptional regulator [Thermosipho sp. (in: Bacteria)]|nr:CopG family transcriptional regulator [Thermosipho sp. (in: thermotogales)]